MDLTLSPSSHVPAARRKGLLLLVAVYLAAAALPLAFTGPAVALPAIGRHLHASPLALQWVTNAFMLALGSTMMLAGALADRFGRRRVFLLGLAAFVISSLAAGVVNGIAGFDLLRAAQGLAGAALFAGGAAALANAFDGAARVRAFSGLGTSFGVGLAFGPIASGLMIERFGWRSVFWLIAGLGAIAWLAGRRALDESRDPDATRLDGGGAASFTLALGLFTYGLLLAPQRGWTDAAVLGLLAGAAAAFAGFIAIERRVPRPMLELELFRYPRFVAVQLLAAAPAFAYVVLLVLLPVRFVGVAGLSEAQAGALMMALSAPLLVLPLAAGWMTRWFSPASVCGTGLLVAALGILWLSASAVTDRGWTTVVAPMLLIGAGIGLPWGLIDGLAVSVVPVERAGMATGIFSTIRVASEGLALALVTAVLSALTARHLPAGPGTASAAQRLVTGDLEGAAAALGHATAPAGLQQAYGDGFSTLLWGLSGIAVLMAIAVFVFFGPHAKARTSAGEAA